MLSTGDWGAVRKLLYGLDDDGRGQYTETSLAVGSAHNLSHSKHQL